MCFGGLLNAPCFPVALGKFSDGEGALQGTEDNERNPDAIDVKTEGEGKYVSRRKTNDPLGNNGIDKSRNRVSGTAQGSAAGDGGTHKGFGSRHHI